jgi:transcription termination factor Rho
MADVTAPERQVLAGKLVAELQTIAGQIGVRDPKGLRKAQLIDAILNRVAETNGGGGVEAGAGTRGPSGEAGPSGSGEPRGPRNDASSGRRTNGAAPSPGNRQGGGGTAESETAPAQATLPIEPSPAPARAEATAAQRPASGAPGAPAQSAQAPVQGERSGGTEASPQGETSQGAQAGERSETSGGQGGGQRQGFQSRGAGTDTQPRPIEEPRRDQDSFRDRGRRRRRERGRGERTDRGGERGGERQERFEPRERPQREYEEEEQGEPEVRTGVLDVLPEGYGFLRTSGYLPGPEDVYVSLSQIRRFHLRRGDEIQGQVRRPKESEKYQALLRIDTIDGIAPEEIVGRPWFEKLTPLYPEERLRLELPDQPNMIAQRIIDLVAPIGKGQRGMIVSPPKAGKTTIMKQVANSITSNNPECHLIVLLVDERPEEVTDMQRSVKGEIVYSTFDRPSEDHIQVTELTLDRAKRLVELGQDVVILLDGITRLSRAYNLATPASGRILSGGVDSTALYPPKRFFGAARNIEQGGSLTVLATALVETGSRMDEVIFEEFKGTGNWELRLDRRAAEKRIFPAIDIEASGTRKEELLLSSDELSLVWRLRRVLHALEGVAGLELLVDRIRQSKSNANFLKEVQKVPVND